MESYNNEIFFSILFYSLAALFSVGVNVLFFFRARRSKLLSAFLNVQLIILIWLVSKVLKKSAPNDEIAWLWVAIQYIAVCYFGPVFFDFSYLYYKSYRLAKWLRYLMYTLSSINYLVVFTNPFHHLFFRSVTIFESQMGPWFYIHTAMTYLLILSSYVCLIKALLRSDFQVPVLQALLFNLGLLLPILANVVYIFGWIEFSFDITPIVYNMTVIIFGYSAYRYRFLDIKKVTRSMVLDNIHEGIIIIDSNRRIIKQNQVISEMINNYLELQHVERIDDFFDQVGNPIQELEYVSQSIRTCIAKEEDRLNLEFSMVVHGGMRRYILKLEKVKDHAGDYIGYVFRFIDVTKHKELVQNLQEKNEALIKINDQLSENVTVTRQLAAAKERSRISKEIHDILGHSVTVVISLLELSKQKLSTEPDFAREKVVQGMEIIRGGLKELRKSIKKHGNDLFDAEKLREDLKKLIEDYEHAGVNVDYYYKNANIKLSAQVYDTIYRICQEGLTNALRHGHAKNVTVGIRYVEKHIDLFIIDDGNGCEEIHKGNGLAGMENRVKELKGFFSVGSPEGHGFNIHVTLPYND